MTPQFHGYFLLDPRDSMVRYVGITSRGLVRRYRDHIAKSKMGTRRSHKDNWIRSLLLLDLCPILSCQIICETQEDICRWEIAAIAKLRSEGCKLTNAASGGEYRTGWRHSLETRRGLSQGRKGKKMPAPTAEARLNMRLAKLGKKKAPFSAAARANMSRGQQGKQRGPSSLATRLLISQAQKGKRLGPRPSLKIPIFLGHLKARIVREIDQQIEEAARGVL